MTTEILKNEDDTMDTHDAYMRGKKEVLTDLYHYLNEEIKSIDSNIKCQKWILSKIPEGGFGDVIEAMQMGECERKIKTYEDFKKALDRVFFLVDQYKDFTKKEEK